jgi:catechol 2,3-dioxygenase-like lactoylglutathione lyase family enzyme
MLQIKITSVLVNDQEKALQFYTEILGFLKQNDITMGEQRWLTVVSPASDSIELLLEPTDFAPARAYQKKLYEAGIPLTAFAVEDVHAEYERLCRHNVIFETPPTEGGPVTVAVFEDTCGNLIQIYQVETGNE